MLKTFKRPARLRWAGCLAAGWAFIFAGLSFYWAAGGVFGLSTVGVDIERLSRERDSQMVTLTWVTGLLKAAAGLVAVYVVQSRLQVLPRWIPRYLLWVIAAVLLLYGSANLVQHALMELGVVEVPDGLGASAVRWHLLLWDPFWILGGLLFLATAREYSRTVTEARDERPRQDVPAGHQPRT